MFELKCSISYACFQMGVPFSRLTVYSMCLALLFSFLWTTAKYNTILFRYPSNMTIAAEEGIRQVFLGKKRYDPNTSMIMYRYSNNGNNADLKKQRIPNFALNFLHEAAVRGLDKDISKLTYLEDEKTSYKYSFLNCIAEQQDYLLYRSLKDDSGNNNRRIGATPQLFLLYQTYILKYPVKSLQTAYKITEYMKSKVDIKKLAVNIQRDIKKQNTVKKWIISMASEGLVTFEEHYGL